MIVVNATYQLAPWADILYAADHRFWVVYHQDIVRKFSGELWTVSEQAREQFGLYWIHHANGPGLSKEPGTINGGGNSGYQAIHLAATFGAARIVLLGYDMQLTDGKFHWHGKHEGGLHNGTNFTVWMSRMKRLAEDLQEAGVEVINCTRKTALKHFPRKPLESVF